LIELILTVVYIVTRRKYEDIKLVPYFMEVFFIVLTILFIASGNVSAAETTGSVIFFFFTLTVIELFITKLGEDKLTKYVN